MSITETREVWQRGPIAGVPGLLQPVAHALLQAKEEVEQLMGDFPSPLLFEKPGGVASPAFHLRHLTGVLDRLFTYAGGQSLSQAQLQYLSIETKIDDVETAALVAAFTAQVEKAIDMLRLADTAQLTEARGVGRAQIPSTVMGLYVHAAEHTMRHVGQLHVTVKVLLVGPPG